MMKNACEGPKTGTARRKLCSSTAIGTALCTVLLSAAFPCLAQSTVATQTKGAPSISADSDQSKSADALAEVVVTSSRIVRNGYNAPTPTTMLGTAEIQQSGATNLGEFLTELPSFQGGNTQQGTSIASQLAGGNYVNLR